MELEIVQDLVKNIALKEGLEDIQTEINSGKKKGDGFLGDMTFVDVKDPNNQKKLYLILKKCLTEQHVVDKLRLNELYNQEVYFYNKIFPELDEFQTNNKVKHPFKCIAKYYDSVFYDIHRVIVFDNIRSHGFEMFPKKLTVDDEHVSLIFTEYGKFHGLSFAYKEKHPDKFFELAKPLINVWNMLAVEEKSDLSKSFIAIFESISHLDDGENCDLKENFKKYKERSDLLFIDASVYKGKHQVICHGDCWTNNFMFKYKKNGNTKTVEEVRFLDWQLTCLGTPIFDLSYFFYSSASIDQFKKLDHFLRIYHDSLSATLKDFGLDADKVYSFSALKEDWRDYCKFGFMLGIMLQRMKLVNDDEIMDLHDVKPDEDSNDAFFATGFDKVTFEKRILDLIRHMNDIGGL